MTPSATGPKNSSGQRRSLIVETIQKEGRVEVSELSSRFNVSEETIRRDLKALEQAGQLLRAHGGAIPARPLIGNRSQTFRELSGANIARYALSLLPAQGTVFIGPGRLGESLASMLPNSSTLQIITNSIHVALKASRHPNLAVFNLGGTVDPIDGTQTGQWTREESQSLRLDISFIAPRGMSTDGYLTAPNPQLSSLLRTVIDVTDRTVILADHESLTNTGLVKVAALSSLSDVIVETESADYIRALLHGHDTLIHIADESPEHTS